MTPATPSHRHKVDLSFNQYENCLRSNNRKEGNLNKLQKNKKNLLRCSALVCWQRPCLVALRESLTCLTIDLTTFHIFSKNNLTFTRYSLSLEIFFFRLHIAMCIIHFLNRRFSGDKVNSQWILIELSTVLS